MHIVNISPVSDASNVKVCLIQNVNGSVVVSSKVFSHMTLSFFFFNNSLFNKCSVHKHRLLLHTSCRSVRGHTPVFAFSMRCWSYLISLIRLSFMF